MADIIQFPEAKIIRNAPAIAESIKTASVAKQVDELVYFMTDALYKNLVMNGLEENEDFTEKDFPFLAETLKSTIYRGFGLDHYIQELVDDSIDEAEEEAEAEAERLALVHSVDDKQE